MHKFYGFLVEFKRKTWVVQLLTYLLPDHHTELGTRVLIAVVLVVGVIKRPLLPYRDDQFAHKVVIVQAELVAGEGGAAEASVSVNQLVAAASAIDRGGNGIFDLCE